MSMVIGAEEPDIKLMLEVGAAVCLDKPIIVVALKRQKDITDAAPDSAHSDRSREAGRHGSGTGGGSDGKGVEGIKCPAARAWWLAPSQKESQLKWLN